MAEKIAVINDLSGFGKCSLTAAIPVISVMGVQPCPLPTAILSAQTGYDSYYLDDYTEKMEDIRREWERMGACFEGIYTGFMAGEKQIEQVFDFLETFRRKETFLLVDPIMGDDGARYDMFTEGLLGQMKELVRQADIVTPNLTELCLIADADYETVCGLPADLKVQVIRQMAESLLRQGVKTVIVTGIHFANETGKRIGNLALSGKECRMIDFPYIGRSFSGTGDLFASVIAGGTARGDELFGLCRLAGRFIEESMRDSAAAGVDSVGGTEFERHLAMLLPQD